MRKILFLPAVAALLCTGLTAQPQTGHPANTPIQLMAESKKGITLMPPPASEWRRIPVQQRGMLANFISKTSGGTSLSVASAVFPNMKTLPDNFPEILLAEEKRNVPIFKQTAKKRIAIAGESAWQIDGLVPAEKKHKAISNRQVYVLHDGLSYIFTLTTDQTDFSKFTPAMDALIKSAHWIAPPPGTKQTPPIKRK